MFRSEPPINYIDASGKITKSFGRGLLVQAHGFCMDHDGNLWAGDSGPFAEDPSTKGRGFQLHKLTQDGKLLFSLGKAGVSAAGGDTFIGPTACAVAANGDIIVADGHWPRPASAQQDGDRLVRLKPDGTFVRAVGSLGAGPGQFMGPHSLAFDSRGRLFVADRSNNRVQVLDENLEFVDEWKHFGRPSGVAILADDTLIGPTGYLYGGLIGAVVFKMLQEFFSTITPQYWQFWIGLVLVVIVLVGRDRMHRWALWLPNLVIRQIAGRKAVVAIPESDAP